MRSECRKFVGANAILKQELVSIRMHEVPNRAVGRFSMELRVDLGLSHESLIKMLRTYCQLGYSSVFHECLSDNMSKPWV